MKTFKLGQVFDLPDSACVRCLHAISTFFRKTLFGPLEARECCDPKFLQGLLAHTQPGIRVSLTIFFYNASKIGLNCSVRDYNFGVCGRNATTFCHMTCHKVGIITYVGLQLLGHRSFKISENITHQKLGAT